MKAFKAMAMAALLFANVHAPAMASNVSSEITDMWWNPAESGWGINVVLQGDVAFATFFLYDTAHNPVWYTAQLTKQSNAFVWSGGLYATSGPWFGGPFNPASVSVRTAGSARFESLSLRTAVFSYTVDGVAVTKTIERQTWTNENYSGNYAGGYSIRASGCNPTSFNGVTEVGGALNVTQNGLSVTMASASNLGTCTFSGTYSQIGKLGSVAGNYACSSGEQGPFLMFEMTPTISGFTARVQGANQFCTQWSGFVGGIARAQ
jgi:hypothetical protein